MIEKLSAKQITEATTANMPMTSGRRGELDTFTASRPPVPVIPRPLDV
jgi:hypothetical protein